MYGLACLFVCLVFSLGNYVLQFLGNRLGMVSYITQAMVQVSWGEGLGEGGEGW